jgi:hypothetical protein
MIRVVSLAFVIISSFILGAFIENVWLRNALIGVCVILGGVVWQELHNAQKFKGDN